jgi:hypothetical protein
MDCKDGSGIMWEAPLLGFARRDGGIFVESLSQHSVFWRESESDRLIALNDSEFEL